MQSRSLPWPAALQAVLCLLLLSGCATPAVRPSITPDDTIKAAQQLLTDRCLTSQGLTPPRTGQQPPTEAEERRVSDALFGAGRTELSMTLPTGFDVRGHTDGCLASAQRALYGDQRRWFRVSTTVNNLKPEAAYRDRSLASVRHLHRSELSDWRRLRARALDRATELLTRQRQKETQPS
jgi:hypothetical protein